MFREALGVTGNPMTVQFDFSRDEVVKARLAYAGTTRFARGFRRYGFLFLCAAFFLIFLAQNDPFQGELVIKDESVPIVSASITIAMVLFVSILFAWGGYHVLKAMGRSVLVNRFQRLPAAYFGERTVALTDEGLSIRLPLADIRYDWRLVDSILETPNYLFFVEPELLTTVPAKAFGSAEERFRFVSRAKALIAEPSADAGAAGTAASPHSTGRT